MLMQAQAGQAAVMHRRPPVACLAMLERANYLTSSGVQLPRAELVDRLTAIVMAAFQAVPEPPA